MSHFSEASQSTGLNLKKTRFLKMPVLQYKLPKGRMTMANARTVSGPEGSSTKCCSLCVMCYINYNKSVEEKSLADFFVLC